MKSMFTLTGQIVNVFQAPKGVSRKTGEEYGGQDKVQIMGEIPLENGQSRMDLVTLTTDQGEQLKKYEGRQITVPVSFYAPSRGVVSYFIPKGCQFSAASA